MERIGREHRLRASRDFARVKSDGVPFRGRYCLVVLGLASGEPTRVGFVASRRGVGNAVQRNRARRRLREIVRRRWERLPKIGYLMMFIAHRSALAAPYQDLASDVERVLAAAGALGPPARGAA